MNLDVNNLKIILQKAINLAKNNAVFIFILIGLATVGFLVFQIRTLSSLEPDDDLLLEKMGVNKPVRIDEESVEIIKELQDTNVEVKALFEQGRTNPFQN